MHQIRGHTILEEAINKAKEQYQSGPRLVAIEKEVIAKYGSMFNPRDLDNLTAIDFKKFLSYEKNKHWKNIHRYGGKIVADMDRLVFGNTNNLTFLKLPYFLYFFYHI
jgi:hypothetical protein